MICCTLYLISVFFEQLLGQFWGKLTDPFYSHGRQRVTGILKKRKKQHNANRKVSGCYSTTDRSKRWYVRV